MGLIQMNPAKFNRRHSNIPGAPTATAATFVFTNGFTANWNLVVNATSYKFDLSTASNFSSFVPGYEDLTVYGSSLEITGLVFGTTYYYRVRSANSIGTSANSNTITQATTVDPPGIPTGVNVFERGSNSWGVSWSDVTGANLYRVQWRVNGGEFLNATTSTLSYNSPFSYTDCDYIEAQVRAEGDGGIGEYSALFNVYINCL